jgi:hypothetical protein
VFALQLFQSFVEYLIASSPLQTKAEGERKQGRKKDGESVTSEKKETLDELYSKHMPELAELFEREKDKELALQLGSLLAILLPLEPPSQAIKEAILNKIFVLLSGFGISWSGVERYRAAFLLHSYVRTLIEYDILPGEADLRLAIVGLQLAKMEVELVSHQEDQISEGQMEVLVLLMHTTEDSLLLLVQLSDKTEEDDALLTSQPGLVSLLLQLPSVLRQLVDTLFSLYLKIETETSKCQPVLAQAKPVFLRVIAAWLAHESDVEDPALHRSLRLAIPFWCRLPADLFSFFLPALSHLSFDPQLRHIFVRENGVERLVHLLSSTPSKKTKALISEIMNNCLVSM